MRGAKRGRPTLFFACVAALVLALSSATAPVFISAAEAAPAKASQTARTAAKPRPPARDAAIVVDGATGKVLYARNPDASRYPASLTKMMTLYLLFEALDKGTITLDTPLIASPRAAAQSPTKLSVPPGGSISVDTAIKALAVLSANDVAVMVAEALGGGSESTFAEMMTRKARELGMTKTVFRNASGLPHPQQTTTARDMALLGRHLAYDFPHYYHYFRTPSFTYEGRTYSTHNHVTRTYEGADGIKTGYTYLSGFNLVTSAVRNNKHVVGVVMGGATAALRDREMVRLLNAAFDVSRQDPSVLVDANVPWKGGKGPGIELFNPNPGENHLMQALLELGTAKSVARGSMPSKPPVLAAVPVLKPAVPGKEILLAATITPILKPLPRALNPLQLVAIEQQPVRLEPELMIRELAAPDLIAQGDSDDEPSAFTVLPAPKPALSDAGWTVQIGAYASEALARAELANAARRSRDVVGKAERLVLPFLAVSGKTLYRARFGTFEEGEARRICKRMSERGETCFAAPLG